MVETADSVLIREVSFVQSVLYREVLLYYFLCVWEGGGGVECEEEGELGKVWMCSSMETTVYYIIFCYYF